MKPFSFAKKFIAGAGSVLDLFPTPPKNPIANKSDEQHLASDWQSIGNDFRKSIGQVDEEQKQNR